jgi:hypothetical protein
MTDIAAINAGSTSCSAHQWLLRQQQECVLVVQPQLLQKGLVRVNRLVAKLTTTLTDTAREIAKEQGVECRYLELETGDT